MEWQDIATLRDNLGIGSGNTVIVAVPGKEQDEWIVGEAYRENDDPEYWWWANTGPGDYSASSINEGNYHLPTKWQPLPPPPKEDKQCQEANKT